ncbi:unnamed protein product [Cylicocyclus nassatus]|uniref:Uncharacterized protein n=1 Tax=Cylicocyclus nassatus TaxID=53992 RepID=A0AA36HE15_CYLNA|nr:unnamed protein product [Cylicocyclus nassatus]
MSFGAESSRQQLYTKRNFVQVGDGNRIVRFRDRSEPRCNGRQRLIRLIPLVEESLPRDGVISGLQLRTVGEARRELNDCPRTNGFRDSRIEHEQHPTLSDFTSDCRTNIEKLTQEKSRLQHEFENVYRTSNILETGAAKHEGGQNNPTNAILSAIKDDLRVLLYGQQNIGFRLDSLQKEQIKNKNELEADLARIKEELKSGLAEKPVESSDLTEVRQKQQNLYNEFNILFLRLDEIEQLVANLLRDTKEEMYVKTGDQQQGKVEELTKSESLQSVLSISSGSSVEDPSSQLRKSRKPSQAFLFSQSLEEPKVAIGKAQTTDVTRF